MANYSAQYTFGVSAETKSAQSSLNALSKSLREIATKKYTMKVDDASITRASNSAFELQQALIAATNVNTGKIDFTKLNSSLQQAGTSISQLGQNLLAAGEQGQRAFGQLANTIAMSEAPVKRLNQAFTNIGTTLMNTIKWQASSSLIHGLMSSISGAISYAKNLNSTLTDIRVVTGANADEMAHFATAANRAAKELSTSTNEFAKASLIYYQQGDSAELAAKKAAITTKAANVAFTASAQEMSEMLTAVWNSYQVGEDQLEHVVDVLAKLGATTASSMEEMATGMQKVAATANTVGVSMEQMSAMIATSASVTRQAPETIGTAWNTILSRIGGLKLGDTLEDGTDLNKYSKALQTIGVNILDASGNLRDMGGVVDEIGAKWDNLNQAQKSALAQTVGGARQYTQILAFFENFDKYQANMKTAQNSDGALQEQANIYAESWEAASKRVQAAMETLYSQLIDDKAITKLTSFFATIINGFTSLTQSFGGAGNVISLLVTQIAQSHLDTVATKITEIGTNIKTLFSGNAELDNYSIELAKMQRDLMTTMQTDDINASLQTELNYDAQILSIKSQLAAQQSTLTRAQKESLEIAIQQAQAAKEHFTALQRQAEAAKTQGEITKRTAADQLAQARAQALYKANNVAGADLTKESYKIQKDWLKAANEVSIDPTAKLEGASEKINNLNQLMDSLGIKADTITVNSLVDTLSAAAEKTGTLEAQAQQFSNAFTDAKTGVIDFGNYLGTPEEALKRLQDEIKEVFKDQEMPTWAEEIQKITEVNPGTLPQLQAAVKNLSEALAENAVNARQDLSALEKLLKDQGFDDNIIKKIVQDCKEMGRAGVNADQLSADIKRNMDQIKKDVEKSLTAASTKVKTFVNVAMTLQRVASAFTAVKNAIDTVKDPNIDNWQKFTTVISTLVTVGMAASSVMNLMSTGLLKNVIASAAAAGASASMTALKTTETVAWYASAEGVKAFTKALATNPITGALVAITLLIAGLVALISWLGSLESNYDKLAKKNNEYKASLANQKEKVQTVTSDVANLAQTMNDTTLTYTDQIAKINEIAAAYGVQGTAIDALTGHYTNLRKELTLGIAAQAEANAQAAEDLAVTAKANSDAALEELRGIYNWDAEGNPMYSSLLVGAGDLSSTGAASLLTDEAWWSNGWGDRAAGTHDKYTNGIFNKGKEYYGQYLSAEGQLFMQDDEIAEQFKALGFVWDTASGALIEAEGAAQDFAGLYRMLTSGDFAEYSGKSGTYTNNLVSTLQGAFLDTQTSTEDYAHDTRLISNLLNNPNIDLFGSRKHSLTETDTLINQVLGNDVSAANRNLLYGQLSGTTTYGNAIAELQALDAITATMASSDEMIDAEQVRADILKQITDSDGAITEDVLLRIHASDIELDETTGKYKISEQSRKLAQAQVDVANAQAKQALLKENQKTMTASTLTGENYTTLKDSGIFNSDAELMQFVMLSASERAARWDEMMDEAMRAEHAAYENMSAAAQARIDELSGDQGELTTWLNTFLENNQKWAQEWTNIIGDKTGDEAFAALRGYLLKKQQKEAQLQERIRDYENAVASGDWTSYQTKHLNGAEVDKDKEAKTIAGFREELTATSSEVTRLNSVLAEGIDLDTALVDATDDLAAANNGLKSLEFDELATRIKKATTAVKTFENAMTNYGSLTAEELGQIAIYSGQTVEEVLAQYNTLSKAEWAETMYQNAMKWYKEQLRLYELDAAKQQEIRQQMQATTKAYYENRVAIAQQAAQTEWDVLEEQSKKISTAISTLGNADLSTFSGIEKLRQALIDVGYEAEEADRLIKSIGKTDDKNKTDEELRAALDAKIALRLKGEDITQAKQHAAEIIVTEIDNTKLINAETQEFVEIPDGSAKFGVTALPDTTAQQFIENGTWKDISGSIGKGTGTIYVDSSTGSTWIKTEGTNGPEWKKIPNGEGALGEATGSATITDNTGTVWFLTEAADGSRTWKTLGDTSLGKATATGQAIDDTGGQWFLDNGVWKEATGSKDLGTATATANIKVEGAPGLVQAADGQWINLGKDVSLGTAEASVDVGITGNGQVYVKTDTNGWEPLNTTTFGNGKAKIIVGITGDGRKYIKTKERGWETLTPVTFESAHANIDIGETGDGKKYINANGKWKAITREGEWKNPETTIMVNLDGDGACLIDPETGYMKPLGKMKNLGTGTIIENGIEIQTTLYWDDTENKYFKVNEDGSVEYLSEEAIKDDAVNREFMLKVGVQFDANGAPVSWSNGVLNLNLAQDTHYIHIKTIYDDQIAPMVRKAVTLHANIDETTTPYQGTGSNKIWSQITDYIANETSLNTVADYFGNGSTRYGSGFNWAQVLMNEYGGDITAMRNGNNQAFEELLTGTQALTKEVSTVAQEVWQTEDYLAGKTDKEGKFGHFEHATASSYSSQFGTRFNVNGSDLWANWLDENGIDEIAAQFFNPATAQWEPLNFDTMRNLADFNSSDEPIEIPIRWTTSADLFVPISADDLAKSDAFEDSMSLVAGLIGDGIPIDDIFPDEELKAAWYRTLLSTFDMNEQGKYVIDEANKMGMWLIYGLVVGMDAENATATLAAMNIAQDVIDKLLTVFEIASPSKRTREMGKYLVQGLAQGLNETELDIGKFGEEVLADIKRTIDELPTKGLWDTLIGNIQDSLFSEDFDWSIFDNPNSDAFANWIGSADDESKNWLLQIANQGRQTPYTTFDAALADYVSGEHNAWSSTNLKYNNDPKRQFLVTQGNMRIKGNEKDGYQIVDAFNDTVVLLDEIFESEEAAIDAAGAMVLTDRSIADYFDNKQWWTNKEWSNMSKLIMDSIYKQTLKNLGNYNNYSEYITNGGTDEQFWAEYNKQYKQYCQQLENDSKTTWANIADDIDSTLSAMDSKDAALAEKILDRWKKIYAGVKEARLAAIKDPDATYGTAISADNRRAMIEQGILNGQFKSTSDIMAWYTGKIDTTDKSMQYQSYSSIPGKQTELGSAYTGFSTWSRQQNSAPTAARLPNGAPIITSAEAYAANLHNYDFLHTQYQLANRLGYGKDMQTGLSALMTGKADLSGNKDIPGLADYLMSQNSDMTQATADALVGAIAAAMDKQGITFDKNQGTAKIGNNIYTSAEILTEAIIDDLAATLTADSAVSPKLQAELERWDAGETTFDALSEEAQKIILQYGADAAKAIDDFWSYMSEIEVNIKAEYDAKISDLKNKQELIQSALKNGATSLSRDKQDELVTLMKSLGYNIGSIQDLTGPNGIQMLQSANTKLGNSLDDATTAVGAFSKALKAGIALITDEKTGEVKGIKEDGTEISQEQIIAQYGKQTSHYAEDATTFNTDTAIANQSAWIKDVNSDLATLDTLQQAVAKGADDISVKWQSLINTLDLTNPEIASAVEQLDRAVQSGRGVGEAWDHMTEVILRSGNVVLTQTPELAAASRVWADQYLVVDKAGKAFTAASLNALKYGNAAKQLEKILNKCNATLKINAKSMSQLKQEARAAGKTMDQFTENVEGLTDADRDAIRSFDEMYDSFEDLNKLGMPSFTDEFADQLAKMSDPAEAYDAFMDNWLKDITAKYGNIESAMLEGANVAANAASYMGNATVQKLQQAGVDVSAVYDRVIQELRDAHGDWTKIDWGTLVGVGGADMKQLMELASALLQVLYEAQGTGIFEVSDLISATQRALAAFQNVQSKYGGGASNGGARNGYRPPEEKAKSGSGSDKKTKTVKEYKRGVDEKERYHEIRDQLEIQTNLLDRIDKLKSRTYGAKHLKNLNDEIAALQKINDLNARYLAEAQVNFEANRKQLTAAGATFNEDGTLNYEEFMDKIIADYNAAVERYNNSEQSPGDQLALDDAEERYNELTRLLKEYEEDLDLIDTIQTDILEQQNKISAAALEGIEYKVTVVTDLNEQTVKGLEYWQDLWDETLDKAGIRMHSFLSNQSAALANLNVLQTEYNDLMTNANLTEADRQQGLKKLNSEMLKQLEELDDIAETMRDYYGETLKLANDELKKYTDKLTHASDVMAKYIGLQQLMGLGEKFADLTPMYESQLNASIANVEAAKGYLDVLKNQKAEIEAIAAEQGWTDTLKQQWDDVEEYIIEGENTLLQNTETALQNAQSAFENAIKAAVAQFDTGISGLKGSFKDLENDYAYYETQQSWYLSTVKELFEISKLTRQIDQSINDATTQTSKQRLAALRQEIELQSKNNDLTEYDVKMMELQYKHALALQALEDAKNAKATVRLTRDENGNYGYQYTADDNAINDAQQKVDDALQAINELTVNRAQEVEKKRIQIEREYRDNMLALAADTTLSIEERAKRMEELNKQHQEALLFYQEQYGNATSALFINQEYVAKRFSTTISEVRGQYNTDMMDMFASTKEYVDYLNEQFATGTIAHAFDNLTTSTSDVLTAADLSSSPEEAWGQLTESVSVYEEAVKQASQAASDVNTELEIQGKNIADVTATWAAFEQTLDNVRESYMSLYKAATATQQLIAGTGVNGQGVATGLIGTDDNGYNPLVPGAQQQWEYSWQGGTLQGNQSGYDSQQAAYAGAMDDIRQKFMSLRKDEETPVGTINAWMAAAHASLQIKQYLRGGLVDYTGPAWVDGSSTTPELMLNADDTTNMLKIVQTLHGLDTNSILNSITQGALGMLYALGNISFPGSVNSNAGELQQNVHITAEFPNATDHSEIEQAFSDIINMATQYANRR